MQLLTLNFLIYTIGGVWRPIEWSSNGAKLSYDTFTFIILFMLYFLVLSQFLYIALVVDNIDDFVTNSFILVGAIAVCCKATIVTKRRQAIINLVQLLLKEPCKPRNENEILIQAKFDDFIKSCTIKYLLLATGSVTSVTIGSVLAVMQGHLPYRVWLPFDTNIPLIFWIISIQQIMTVIFATIINIGTETLVFGLFLQTCVQFEIFECRLLKLVTDKTRFMEQYPTLSNKKIIISDYIRHHLIIYKYAKTVNAVFNQALFLQFCGSILILCSCVYYISIHITESETVTLLTYIICMFVQIYLYCWSGNEVILKSMSVGDAVYNSDWPSLSVSEKKDLWMIMMRSTIPTKFSSSFLITLSLQAYSNILKTSYSAFNVLQQS
nr:PREDICTED: odorant receptor 46a, isoform A-like [Linepithema humile]